jgi:hypothetical protein
MLVFNHHIQRRPQSPNEQVKNQGTAINDANAREHVMLSDEQDGGGA